MAMHSEQQQVNYTSGNVTYIESLQEGRWAGHSWSAGDPVEARAFGDSHAFEICIQDRPSVDIPETVLSEGWQWVSAGELPKTDRGARHLVVKLTNSIWPVTVQVHTLLDGTPVFTRWLEITNQFDKPIALSNVAPWSGRLWSQDAPIHLGHSPAREAHSEGRFVWTPLPEGVHVIRNDTDRLWDDPYFVLRNEASEEYFFGQLAWTTNYRMEFDRRAGLSFKIGPIAPKLLRVLEAGETTRTPAVHLGLVRGDFDSAVHAMHDHIRRSVLPVRNPERAYRSQCIVSGDWSVCHYHGEGFNEANMQKCIDVAAATGLEVFILDGPTWVEGFGKWLSPDRKRFPRGLKPLAARARKKGLLWGLYFEADGGRDGPTWGSGEDWGAGAPMGCWRDSDVYREHPEWFERANLLLTIPEAAEYLEAEVGRVIEHYDLDLYRHDANGIVFFPPGAGGSQTLRGLFVESDAWRYHENFFGLFERVHERYPDVILQQASAGGYRLDLGTAGAFDEHFAGDFGGQLWTYRNFAGMTVFLPPEAIVIAFGLCRPEDLPDLDTSLRGAYALGTTPMFFTALLPASVEAMTPQEQQRYQHYAEIYKSFIRPLLPTSKVYHLAPINATDGDDSGDWLAMQFLSPDQEKGWALIVKLSETDPDTYLVRPRGLDDAKSYKVSFDNTRTTKVFSGADLLRDGLEISVEPERRSELLLFEAE